jgi:hypothetical protein
MKQVFHWSILSLLLCLVACQNTAEKTTETENTGNQIVEKPNLTAILTAERDHYLAFLAKKINSFPKDSIVTELLLKDSSPAAKKLSNELFRTFRGDAMVKESGEFKMQDFNEGVLPAINATISAENKLPEIIIKPFLWNSLEMKWDKAPQNWQPIYDWANTAMDTKNTLQKQADGWRHSLHGFTQPTLKADSSCHLILDAGTVDTEKIIELLQIAHEQGIQKVIIGNDLK